MKKDILGEYKRLLDLVYMCIDSIGDRVEIDHRKTDIQLLAFKFIFHALSLYQLSQGTSYKDYHQENRIFYDFGSTGVILRALVENYVIMNLVFFKSESDDEFEFFFCLWKLSGLFPVIENSIPKYQTKNFTELIQAKEDFSSRIIRTNYYQSLKTDLKKKSLKGDMSSWRKTTLINSFGEKYSMILYSYLSGVAHSDSLSGSQFLETNNKEQKKRIGDQILFGNIILSKFILCYKDRFHEASEICERNKETFYRARTLSRINLT